MDFRKAEYGPLSRARSLVPWLMFSLTGWFRAKVDRIRKRSGDQPQKQRAGCGLAIAIGSLLDGIPESGLVGLGLLAATGVRVSMFAAIALSNLSEGLSRPA